VSVTYRDPGPLYFARRGLKRHAGVWSLWALGVAAVISGDFAGWNLGIPNGGWGGLAVAAAVITVMYVGLCYSIAEMSPALPHTGGAYSFGRSAMGPWGGFITGLAENVEYVVTPAVVVFFAGAYAQPVVKELIGLDVAQPVWWVLFYAAFVGLNIAGIETTLRFSVAICALSLAILAVFFVGALAKFDARLLFTVGDGSFLPFGVAGIFKNLPYAIWFYLAIEELPLAAEESMDPRRDIPRGTLLGLLTLAVAAGLVLVLNVGIPPGAKAIGTADAPLLTGFATVFGTSPKLAAVFGLLALAGLIASFHTIIFAYGRNIYSLSRAGYLPRWMSVTHGTRKTPHVALVLGAVVGWVLAWIMYRETSSRGSVGAALLTMAVFGGVISYVMQMLAFILLRRNLPDMDRPYRSPLGVPGAAIAGIIALVSLISLYLDPTYRPGVYGVAVWFLLGIVYFAVAGRHRLVRAPEEDFALSRSARQ
jgi:ethanolamine permease